MEEGHCDALLLAFAGIHRMGYGHLIKYMMPIEEFTPPVGQGCVAVEAHERMDQEMEQAIHQAVNHSETSTCMFAERAFLRRLEGGCSIPVFGMASLTGDQITMTGGIVSLDGSVIIRKQRTSSQEDADALGTALADDVLSAGGKKILDQIKAQL